MPYFEENCIFYERGVFPLLIIFDLNVNFSDPLNVRQCIAIQADPQVNMHSCIYLIVLRSGLGEV